MYTTYAVGARGRSGTLWVPPSQPFFLLAVGHECGRQPAKMAILEGLRPPNLPLERRLRNSCDLRTSDSGGGLPRESPMLLIVWHDPTGSRDLLKEGRRRRQLDGLPIGDQPATR